MEKMSADARIKLAIGSQFVEIQQLQDHIQALLAENASLKTAIEKSKKGKRTMAGQ